MPPWDLLNWQGADQSQPSLLEAGRIIGFQVGVPDCDTEPGQFHSYHTLAGQPTVWREADQFVDGELLPCDEEGCGAVPPTAVRADSWGRIKASFR